MMGYISTGMGDHFSPLRLSLMALRLALVDQNPFSPVNHKIHLLLWILTDPNFFPIGDKVYYVISSMEQSSCSLSFKTGLCHYFIK